MNMSSQVFRAQTDEDTFFVLVEDTVSLQSYDSAEKALDCNDRKYCLSDEPQQEANASFADSIQTYPFETEGLNQHFLDEIMSAMEDDQVDLLLNEAVDQGKEEESTIFLDPQQNQNTHFKGEQHIDDTVSINSHTSELSNKSFVFVPSNNGLSSVGSNGNRSPNVNRLSSGASSITDITSINYLSVPLHSGRTEDTISTDGLRMFEYPTLEYDDSWQMCRQSSSSSTKIEEPQKVLIRELSDDSLKDVEGVDLMAPVFLAITGESGDHVTDMKRKSKSIEDLCSVTLNEDCRRRRSRSDVAFQQKLKSKKYLKANQCTNLSKVIDSEEIQDSLEDNDTVLLTRNSSIKSHISFDDLRLVSTASGHLYEYDGNELFEDPDVYIDDVYEEYTSNDLSGDIISLTYPSDIEENNSIKTPESWKEVQAGDPVSSGEDEITLETDPSMLTEGQMFKYNKDKKGELKRSPRCIPGSQCGFLEYPYGEGSPLGSPHKVRRLVGCNTSPDSPAQSGGLHDRIVVNVNGEQRIIDMHLIEPYLKVLSHGGHHRIGDECRDIVVFAACFLPEKTTENYSIIMEQLFFYCIHAVDLLVADSYEIIFFNSALESKNMPARKWIKQYYDLVFYRLKKNLKDIYFVHQSLWLKAALRFSKLFVSSKFRRKIHLIQNIQTLKKYVPLDYIFIPENITKVDESFQ